MPKMGESINEGTIINWLVNEGDSFNEGDILLEVATDKVDNEVPAPASGKMLEHKYKAKDVVPVGEVIAVLELSEDINSEKDVSKKSEKKANKIFEKINKPKSVSPSPSTSIAQSVPPLGVRGRFISPLIDSIARKNHISYEELARIPGTGKDGRLRKSDVSNYLENGRPFQFAQNFREGGNPSFQIPDLKFDKGKGKIVEMDRMGKMIADHMVYSKHTAPHVTAYVEADMTNMAKWRFDNKESFQKKYGEKLTFTPLFVEVVAKALKDFPMINVSMDGMNIIVKEEINVGIATALPTGNLIVAVVKNSDTKDLKTLAMEINSLTEKARNNKLNADDIKGSTFTISNVGTFGSLMGTPIINQPEAAILATGIIKKRAEVIEKTDGDTIEIRSMMMLSLSFDHRIVNGFLGGSFLKRIADYFEGFDVNRKI